VHLGRLRGRGNRLPGASKQATSETLLERELSNKGQHAALFRIRLSLSKFHRAELVEVGGWDHPVDGVQTFGGEADAGSVHLKAKTNAAWVSNGGFGAI
jgi:hypothetical protein